MKKTTGRILGGLLCERNCLIWIKSSNSVIVALQLRMGNLSTPANFGAKVTFRNDNGICLFLDNDNLVNACIVFRDNISDLDRIKVCMTTHRQSILIEVAKNTVLTHLGKSCAAAESSRAIVGAVVSLIITPRSAVRILCLDLHQDVVSLCLGRHLSNGLVAWIGFRLGLGLRIGLVIGTRESAIFLFLNGPRQYVVIEIRDALLPPFYIS